MRLLLPVRVIVIGLICSIPGIFHRLSEAGSTLDQEPTRALIDSHKFSGTTLSKVALPHPAPEGDANPEKAPTLDHLENVGTFTPYTGQPFTGYQGDYSSCSYKCPGLHPHRRRAK